VEQNKSHTQVSYEDLSAGHRRGCDPTVRKGEKVSEDEPHADYPGKDRRDPKEN